MTPQNGTNAYPSYHRDIPKLPEVDPVQHPKSRQVELENLSEDDLLAMLEDSARQVDPHNPNNLRVQAMKKALDSVGKEEEVFAIHSDVAASEGAPASSGPVETVEPLAKGLELSENEKRTLYV